MRPRILTKVLLLVWWMASSVLCGWALEDESAATDPRNPSKVIFRLEAPAREEMTRPGEVIEALRLMRGQVVGDIGAGTGYFARRFARQVGPEGLVFAVDIEPKFLEELARRAAEEGITNIVPVLAQPDNSLLAETSCDLFFLHNVYIHLPDRVAYLKHLGTRLKQGGRIAIIGWRKEVIVLGPVQPKPRSKALAAEQVVEELDAAGFSVAENVENFPERYFLIALRRD